MEPTGLRESSGAEGCSSSPNVGCLKRTPPPARCVGGTGRAKHRTHVLFWRPWTHSSSTESLPQSLPYAKGLCENHQARQKPADYKHPVRLFWPRSKRLDLMYVEADDLLRNFPVQATLSFYDSESDSDNDEENSEGEHDSGFESE